MKTNTKYLDTGKTNFGTLALIDVQRHRNGVGGQPFFAVTFDLTTEGETFRMLATVFDRTSYIAVISLSKLTENEGALTDDNKWRGDTFERVIRNWIERFE